jgi:hypothetical protein
MQAVLGGLLLLVGANVVIVINHCTALLLGGSPETCNACCQAASDMCTSQLAACRPQLITPLCLDAAAAAAGVYMLLLCGVAVLLDKRGITVKPW